ILDTGPSAYFSTTTRVWELALGGLIAAWSPQFPRWLNVVIGSAGISAIALSGLFINPGLRFPGYVALVPTLGAAFVIVSGPENLPTSALGIRPLRFIGDISYSIYLWHWPI